MEAIEEKPSRVDTFAQSLVNSFMLFLVAVGIFWAFDTFTPLKEPEPKVLAVVAQCEGIKLNYPQTITEKINGKKVSFRYNCIRSGFIAQSYYGNCPGCSGRTRLTNEPVRWGVCAVDTDVIAPKSTFYVPDYGPCKAADTGKKIKGKIIDLGFEVGTGWWSRRVTNILTLVE